MSQLMPLPLTVSCFSKIQIGFTFLVPAHLGSPGKKGPLNGCACVCGLPGIAKKQQQNIQPAAPTFNSRAGWISNYYSVRQKKEPIFYCVHLFDTRQQLVNFITYVEEKIRHNSVYLILARVNYFAVTVTLNTLCLFANQVMNWWLPASVYSFNLIVTQHS